MNGVNLMPNSVQMKQLSFDLNFGLLKTVYGNLMFKNKNTKSNGNVDAVFSCVGIWSKQGDMMFRLFDFICAFCMLNSNANPCLNFNKD